MNLAAILKMLGIKVAPETSKQIEALIPQIPEKVNELIQFNTNWVRNFDERLKNMEATLERMEQFLYDSQRGRIVQPPDDHYRDRDDRNKPSAA